MRRRSFAIGLTAAALAGRPAAAQSPARPLRIGLAGLTPLNSPHYRAFLARMAEHGFVEGHGLVFDFIQSPSFADLGPSYAALAARGADIFMATGTELQLSAALQAARGRPIVMLAIDYDPFARGHVATLARPGGSITGVFVRQIELAEKRVELAREVLPLAPRIGLLGDPGSLDQLPAAERAARRLGFTPKTIVIEGENPAYAAALAPLAELAGSPVAVMSSPRFLRDRAPLLAQFAAMRLPAVMAQREQAVDGALFSYGVSLSSLFAAAADFVVRIARGANPADIPVEQPTRYETVINLKTAATLDIPLPPSFLARADEVIE